MALLCGVQGVVGLLLQRAGRRLATAVGPDALLCAAACGHLEVVDKMLDTGVRWGSATL